MSIESLLMLIAGLLAGILFMQVLTFKVQISAADVIKLFNDQLDDRRKSTHRDLGELIEEGKFQDLLNIIDERIKEEPHNSGLYWYKGVAYFNLQKWSEAKEVFEQAIEIDPRYKKDLEAHLQTIEQNI